jgi:hypothetical protein
VRMSYPSSIEMSANECRNGGGVAGYDIPVLRTVSPMDLQHGCVKMIPVLLPNGREGKAYWKLTPRVRSAVRLLNPMG